MAATSSHAQSSYPQSFHAQSSPHRIAIARAGADLPLLVQHAAPDSRPYIHPVLAPDGTGVLTEDAPGHHPWQHGLYVGLNDVNGAGFWTERLRPASRDQDGTFHPAALRPAEVEGGFARWTVDAEWRDPAGAPLLAETQAWTLHDRGPDAVTLDLAWSLRAARDLTFGQYAYGGLFLRMPYRQDGGAALVSSEGATSPAEAEGQRARWVAIAMPIEGRPAAAATAGAALLDHPANPEHPIPWRVDNQFGICPSRSIAGAWQLPAGQSTTSRYRLLFFTGAIDRERIAAEWASFAGG